MTSGHFFIQQPLQVYKNNNFHSICDLLVREIPLKIILNGQNLATLACSPQGYKELALGFLISEGMISRTDQIKSINVSQECVHIEVDGLSFKATSGQGLFINTCSGRGPGDDPVSSPIPVPDSSYRFSAPKLLKLIAQLDETSITFQKTGGVHSAALGWGEDLLIRYEDIGRHNAVDKVLGRAYLDKVPLHDKCLVLSGRIAAEIVSKAIRHRVPLVLSRSAPTLRAVELARASGLTIVGFARGEQFNAYCHWDKINP